MINREYLKNLHSKEMERFLSRTPKSAALFAKAKEVMPGGVPMSWMSKWPGKYPLFVESASGAHFIDVDGNEYIDLCLGDTGSMTGHSPKPTVDAISKQLSKGMTAMLPTDDALEVSKELSRRFNLPLWQFTVSATDANRHVIRYARLISGKKKIIVIDRCYHGSVDESFATLDSSGATISREGNIGAPVPLDLTTRVVEFNDLSGMEEALKFGDVAAILMEPAMTNVGIVLPEEGYLTGVGELAKKYGALWIIDETHTISVGPGGMSAQLGLNPDFLTIGKAIGGGIPTGTFGMTEEIASLIARKTEREVIDTGGIGGTLAGNALSLAAMKATLTQVLTDENFIKMIELGNLWCDGVEAAISEFNLAWHVNRLGARGEYLFQRSAPKTGGEAARAGDFELEQYIHLRLLNDGILLTPFHNMALMSPYTSKSDVDAHTAAFKAMCQELVSV
ncbi:MAG: aminotransferase class III-fold pyridoxal phosphate-dependent enzyme [Actinobacteria bacterium]|uniref:Aminotransferase class III-fold pyridoxal phosphate-dependent enzyme n=1 Tax=Candidatus Fonsibacter lacus TaxID=2576439 RepID=A0A965GDI8_9PROT|nr:aminotransferase class III-fold pyridoxal phosphate-dependent enzyme [Candidatus Fonsibacter lacus]